MKTPKDIGASVRARLLRLARERGEDFQLVLTRYANERFLYRLATSDHASKFVLKGAALFSSEQASLTAQLGMSTSWALANRVLNRSARPFRK